MTPPCAWQTTLQRSFTSFPSGSVGAALLVLRWIVGISASVEASFSIAVVHSPPYVALAAAFGLAGLALLPGVLTPFAGALLAAVGTSILLFENPASLKLLDSHMALFEFIVMAATLSVLGPGAASVDARLYGRREVAIDNQPGDREL
jgi:hypothetical protein